MEGNDLNKTRPSGYRSNAIYLDGSTTRVHLDANGTDYLEESFDGRTISLWLKPDREFYTGPRIVNDQSLVGYYPFDTQSGSSTNDLSPNENKGTLLDGSSLQAGQYGQAVQLDGLNDRVSIPSTGTMSTLNQASHTISLWIMPEVSNSAKYTEGRLHAHGSVSYTHLRAHETG